MIYIKLSKLKLVKEKGLQYEFEVRKCEIIKEVGT